MKRILVAEDESAIREILTINLTRDGFAVTEAEDGEQALALFNNEPDGFDVLLVDLMMPRMDGISLCREVRNRNANVGIIILTAKTQENDKLEGLSCGADDYITKPFSIKELLARIEAVYRRVRLAVSMKSGGSDEITLGDYVLSIKKRAAFIAGNKVELSQIEFQILEMFFSNPGRTVEREEILRSVWGENFYGDDKVVDVNIRRLRVKLEKNPSEPVHLVTVRGKGYKWIE